MATVAQEQGERDAFDEMMRRLHRAASLADAREDEDAAEACRWAASRLRHARALTHDPPEANAAMERLRQAIPRVVIGDEVKAQNYKYLVSIDDQSSADWFNERPYLLQRIRRDIWSSAAPTKGGA